MEAATKNKRGRPKTIKGQLAQGIAYAEYKTQRTGHNLLYATEAIQQIIQRYFPEDIGLFLTPDKKMLRQGVAEQLGRTAEESGEETAIRYAAECIELIKQGAKSKDVEKAIRICRKENRMNKQRRKRISEAIDLLQQAKDILEEVTADEEEALSNLPEWLQESERGETMQEYISSLEEAQDNAETIIEELENVIS